MHGGLKIRSRLNPKPLSTRTLHFITKRWHMLCKVGDNQAWRYHIFWLILAECVMYLNGKMLFCYSCCK